MVPPQTSACPSGMVHVTSEDTSVDVCVDVYEGGIETADGRWPFNKPVDNLPVGSYKVKGGGLHNSMAGTYTFSLHRLSKKRVPNLKPTSAQTRPQRHAML